jgi:hypothetical protein
MKADKFIAILCFTCRIIISCAAKNVSYYETIIEDQIEASVKYELPTDASNYKSMENTKIKGNSIL